MKISIFEMFIIVEIIWKHYEGIWLFPEWIFYFILVIVIIEWCLNIILKILSWIIKEAKK